MNVRILLVLLCFLFAACGAIDSLPRQLLASGKIKGRSPKKATKLDACAGKSIYILDLSVFAEENNVPACNLSEDVKIDPSNGIPFLPDAPGLKYLEQGAPISLAAHGGPWYLHEAISSSPHVTTDIDEADIVYVYDFCYYARWLGQVHTVGSVSHEKESEAGERLIKGFKSVAQLDRWQQNKGADFVFFDPHPGFTDGKSDLEFKRYTCDVMRHSMHIVAERGQRNICKEYWQMHDKLVIAPYVAGSADITKPLLGFKQSVLPLASRKTLLHFRAGCLPYGYFFQNQTKVATGKVLRHAAALALGSEAPDIDVHCTDRFLAGQHMSFPDVVKRMRSSLFCLVLPGDSASARRTSEIFMSGCIPVFLGPPYGSMPFPDDVDYKRSSLIFNITQHRQWLDSEMLWTNPQDERPGHVQNPWYWMPDADVDDVMIQVETMQDMVEHLRNLPKKKLNEMIEAVSLERQKFAYRRKLSSTTSASSIIMSHMCTMTTSGVETA